MRVEIAAPAGRMGDGGAAVVTTLPDRSDFIHILGVEIEFERLGWPGWN
jgi:hypothetical protein